MPLTTLSDLERRLRKLEMLYDQDRHKISPPDRNVNTSHPLDVQTASPGVTDHGALTGLGDNDHPQYLLTTAKAADSELLDGINSTGFVQTSGNQTIGGVKTFSSLPTLPTGIPTANQPVRKGYADLAYLSILATAQNSDKLDNLDSTAFALTGHDHNAAYLGITAKAADSDKLDGLDSSAFLQTSAYATWTPTLVGWSGTPTVYCYYYKLGRIMFFSAIISGTSDSTSTSFTLPEANGLSEYSGAMGWCTDNGTAFTTPGRFSISVGSNVCRAYTNMATGAWTASGTKRISVYGWIYTN